MESGRRKGSISVLRNLTTEQNVGLVLSSLGSYIYICVYIWESSFPFSGSFLIYTLTESIKSTLFFLCPAQYLVQWRISLIAEWITISPFSILSLNILPRVRLDVLFKSLFISWAYYHVIFLLLCAVCGPRLYVVCALGLSSICLYNTLIF